MRISFLYLLVIFCYSTESTFAQFDYFIKYKNEVSHAEINSRISSGILVESNQISLKKSFIPLTLPLTKIEDVKLSRIFKVIFPEEPSQDYISAIISSPEVEYFQKAVVYKVDFIPNDKLISEQWALAKINAYKAWDITTGNDSVIVGVIDTGIDYLHPDLKNQMFINAFEDINANGILDALDNNGIDDDNNGYVDDVIGWDFTDRVGFPFDSTGGDYLLWDNNPADEYGHGTFVAGIIAAETNNNEGISGAAPGVKLLNLRAFDPGGYGEEDDVAAAVIYAVNCGVKVLNMSFGDNSFSYVLRDVLKYARQKGVVLVGSSGNTSSEQLHYPSAFDEVISTGASTREDYISSFSNTGSTIDLVAPGSEILTTALNSTYSSISGTSAAAPYVSAAAALLLSKHNFNPDEVKQILKSTSDDIYPDGWDVRSGAGRLNMERALRIAAPSIIKFEFPPQDYATNKDTLGITATILSPYFKMYELFLGSGLNPDRWERLNSGQNQIENSNIFNLITTQLKDSIYCLKLVILQSNNRVIEERVNFYVNRVPAEMTLRSLNPFYYGLYPTIVAEVDTDEPSVVKMFYRARGAEKWTYVTLDGFASNNQFVKQNHYGFIPGSIVLPETEYEIYFEAVDLGGLLSTLKNNGTNFLVKTDAIPFQVNHSIMNYSLPAGQLFKDPVNFTGGDYEEVLLQDNFSAAFPYGLYKYSNGGLVKIDSMILKYPKSFGDFNNNGKFDLLSSIGRTGFIEEQNELNSSKLGTKFIDSSNAFYPILTSDIDNDGVFELLSVFKDKSLAIWEIDNELKAKIRDTLQNFSENDQLNEFSNSIGFTNAAIADANSDGIKEIWAVDKDGDIFSYIISGKTTFTGDTIHTDFESDFALISSGDYTGDGKDEIAVLLQSSENYSVAPFNLLIIFNTMNNQLNVIYEKYFLDPSEEYKSTFQSAGRSLRLIDIDSDNKNELIVFTFPYSYIIKYDEESYGGRIIYYKENVNSNSVFAGDLNSNGVPEIAFPDNEKIIFIEFAPSQKPSVPVNFNAYSLDSARIQLQWSGSADKYYIFKGNNPSEIVLYDSVTANYYIDADEINKMYFYQVQSIDKNYKDIYSIRTEIKSIFHHLPSKLIKANAITAKNILVEFSGKMNNTIENLNSFYVNGEVYPNSIAAASEYSYLLSFNSLPKGEHKLYVSNIKDFYGSPVVIDSVFFTIEENIPLDEFFIESFELISPYRLLISFSAEPDSNRILNLANYSFEPSNEIVKVEKQRGSANKLILYTKNPMGSVGKEYKLKLNNIISSESSGSITLKNESGSVIVITATAGNLDNEYVYPNPAALSKGSKITFANVPSNCEIYIFNIAGNMVRFIKEKSINGGIDWDLKDENSRFISSGIYIYKIISIDEFGNELQEKLGKFAVTK